MIPPLLSLRAVLRGLLCPGRSRPADPSREPAPTPAPPRGGNPLNPPLLTWHEAGGGEIQAFSDVFDAGVPRNYWIVLHPSGLLLGGSPELCGERWASVHDSLEAAKREADEIERRNRRAVAAEAAAERRPA